MNGLARWRLCDALSVTDAAYLIVGTDPSVERRLLQPADYKEPEGYRTVTTALQEAVTSGRLPATLRQSARPLGYKVSPPRAPQGTAVATDENGQGFIYEQELEWSATTVTVNDLKDWLRAKGITSGFFFEHEPNPADYLDPKGDCYSPKLAAAVRAWEYVSSTPDSLRGKTVKQALISWLGKNAKHYGLADKKGKLNSLGIEEVSKIANWETKGGAPKTP
jgi:hypothetical protein